ncbi:hypothetical protein [Mycolicibacterium sp. P1-5]|uniref:hypothetical protein n=1 Tax=Mycolicibacterium sp. P1-5 TaxID=2024617 RepID=UPI00188420EE|nr:hypothetical protein [Mycolicibacterium sp. P1-5]
MIFAVVVTAVGVTDASLTAWVLEVVVACWLSGVWAGVEVSFSAVADDVAEDVVSETDRLDCALGFSALVSVAVAAEVLAWIRAAVAGLRADEAVFDADLEPSCAGLAVRAECAVPLLAFAGPAETEDESPSGVSALAMATVGHTRDRPSATAAAPARAPRWTFAMKEPPSYVMRCP